MTSTLIDEIANAPDEPVQDSLFGDPIIEDGEPRLTKERKPRRRRQPRLDENGEPIAPTPRAPRNAKLNEDLLEFTVSFASDISAVAPTAAGVLISRAEQTVDGLMALAAGKKRTTAVLRKVASVSKVTELLTTLMMVIVALAVDFGRIDSNSPILDNIGFTELVRDQSGKLSRDDRGMAVKDRKTIRDIYNTMHPDEPTEPPDQSMPSMPAWSPTTGSAKTNMPPMNWVPK
jgi:hypothetical protein